MPWVDKLRAIAASRKDWMMSITSFAAVLSIEMMLAFGSGWAAAGESWVIMTLLILVQIPVFALILMHAKLDLDLLARHGARMLLIWSLVVSCWLLGGACCLCITAYHRICKPFILL
jgi:hypothetical protein